MTSYILKFQVENYHDDIIFDIPNIEIKVNLCDKNQITTYKNGILYCEEAKCDPECSENGYCASVENNSSNNPKKNRCECNEGYNGEICTDKIIVNYRYVLYIILYIFSF